MKRIIFILLVVVTASLLTAAGTTDKTAGRTAVLKEVLRIGDEGGDFYLKQPTRIKTAPDGSIFIMDDEQFLRFDKNGRFINNQQKKGEGPGEYLSLFDFTFLDNKIVLYSNQPAKIIETDITGTLLKEYRLERRMGFIRILNIDGDGYWLAQAGFEDIAKKNSGPFTLTLEISRGAYDGKTEKTGITFPEKWYMLKESSSKGVRMALISLSRSVFTMDGSSTLFASTSQPYGIQRVDLENKKVTGIIKRDYNSVPYSEKEPEEGEKENERSRPKDSIPDFFSDVQYILIHNDHLWVLTSTVEKDKGVLVDVFTKDGKYTDHFYLPLPQVETANDLERKPMFLDGDCLFTVESDEDENPVVVKYKIET